MADSDVSDDSKHDRFRRERDDSVRMRNNERRESPDDRRDFRAGQRRSNRDRSPNEPTNKRVRRNSDRGRNFEDDVVYKTPLMPFKRFLDPLDDHIKDTEAFEKYQIYKDEHLRKQIVDYFEAHKDEEWLRLKYHPDFIDQAREQSQKNIKHRLDVFLDLFENGFIDSQPVQIDNSENLEKLLDQAVDKLNITSIDSMANSIIDHVDLNPVNVNGHTPPIAQKTSEEKSRPTTPTEMNQADGSPSSELENDVPTPTTAEAPDVGVSVTHSSFVASENSMQKKNLSIFFKNLPAAAKRSELEELCKKFDGFLRLAIWDPSPERRFTRYAWATFRDDVSIKNICWDINVSPLIREKYASMTGSGSQEASAIINRELQQRIRPVMPLTRHKEIMLADLQLAAKLVANFDAKYKLWNLDERAEDFNEAADSSNPLLRNLNSHLKKNHVESGDEKEVKKDEDNVQMLKLECDPEITQTLDRLILYLRIVHSFDFYSVSLYPQEDYMPHKCGILHARGDRGISSEEGLIFSQREVDDYIRTFARKMEPMLRGHKSHLTQEELNKLGLRDPETVASEFIQSNIHKRISKKKPFKVVWVCPLSDKKFREPIFVEKHILNKHMDKVEEAKKDGALFFNNYLRDPERPSLPDPPRHIVERYYPSSDNRKKTSNTSNTGGNFSSPNNVRGYQSGNTRYNSNQGGRPQNRYYNRYNNNNQDVQQQAMAALASAAAALGSGSDNKSLASVISGAAASLVATSSGGGNSRGGRHFYNNRGGNSRFNAPSNDRDNSRNRGMVSYTDLDDPNNDQF